MNRIIIQDKLIFLKQDYSGQMKKIVKDGWVCTGINYSGKIVTEDNKLN